MKILISGGGMAGLLLAGLLEKKGIDVVLIEKSPIYDRVGFWIGLYPFSANTLRDIGTYSSYVASSIPMEAYRMWDAEGAALQTLSFKEIFDPIHGELRALHRADLIDILRQGTRAPHRMGTSITDVDVREDGVEAMLSSGERCHADLLVAADGIHSSVRALAGIHTDLLDWGFTAFTWWMPTVEELQTTVQEYWGHGALFGLYPIREKMNAVAGIPTPHNLGSMNQSAIKAYIRKALEGFPALPKAAIAALEHEEVYAWKMMDHCAQQWIKSRIVLVGDAAAGFLPTAGVGASNALKSAQVLADEIGRADARSLPQALSLWEQRVRHRVEANHEASRRLARMIFTRSDLVASGRDYILKHLPMKMIANDVLASNINPW